MKKAPNIIIMTDDQGYGDLSCMGASDLTTPHLDHLAQQGARFNCMYSNVTVKLSVSINESLPEIELAEAKFLSKEAFSIG